MQGIRQASLSSFWAMPKKEYMLTLVIILLFVFVQRGFEWICVLHILYKSAYVPLYEVA